MPISAIHHYSQWLKENKDIDLAQNKSTDILFYGDVSSPRRQQLLSILKEHFNISIQQNLYGSAMLQEIAKAKIVVNLHYYENALLETTRVFEALSLGACVVSEDSPDIDNYSELMNTNRIMFAETGNSRQLVEAIRKMLEHIAQNKVQSLDEFSLISQNSFDSNFSKSLISL